MKKSFVALPTIIAIAIAVVPVAAHAAVKAPARIISLSPSATEILFGIGAGKQVIAVDQNSNYPTNTPITKLDGFTPNVEAITKYKPDLVIVQSTSTKVTQVVAQLKKLGITVITEVTPNNLNDLYAEIQIDGKASHQVAAAQSLIKSMQTKIAAIIKSTSTQKSLKFYHEIDNTNYSATSKTFIGQVYKSFGLTNIADGAKGADATGYPQLTPEYIIQSNPDLIFLADAQYSETTKSFGARAGFSTLMAVKAGHVVELPADIPSRWGPRIVDFYQLVADAMKKVA
jgi:iron complex transport system substrate-binding protein